MTKINSTAPTDSREPVKPEKPRPNFPLFAHATKRWAKKVRGKVYYFGPWHDPKGAEKRWLAEEADLRAGRVPRERQRGSELTLRDLCNRFLLSKQRLIENDELSPRSYADYKRTCADIGKRFGRDRLLTDIHPEDFEELRSRWAKKWGPTRLGNEINRTRIIFNYGEKNGLTPVKIIFGEGFRRPSAKTLRQHRAAKGSRMLEAAEIRDMLGVASVQLRAMILLGVNCGYGNHDVAMLPISALDLVGGWVQFPRPKTAIARRCKLWPETIKALREALTIRKPPKDEAHADRVFITRLGQPWASQESGTAVTHEMAKLLKSLGFNRPGVGFYSLRHVFETIGGEAKDQVAVDAVMGHVDASMAGMYRERISDGRLQAVTDHVHAWLFPHKKGGSKKVNGKPNR